MLIFSYVINNIIVNKNKIWHNCYTLFGLYNKKVKSIHIQIVSEFYIYHLKTYIIDLRFTFYETL
jgi:hypothetical protein